MVCFVIHVEDELVEMLDQLAFATGCDRHHHLRRTLSRYVEVETHNLNATDEGLAEVKADRTVDLESVKARWIARAASRVK
ncbi:CopG family ribbon-helix-helix protein [Pseudomonas viridiflava]|uniref:CopG family ribbon-helix-helix protein n=1 Tax=Pseudomonas viridiflava TaxID=33069 RepID=UPI0023DDFF06|nr:ribbon-helix-helix protein, CopG family [Pseudomonas viridiflava]